MDLSVMINHRIASLFTSTTLMDRLKENEKVTFEIAKGDKGPKAVNVKKTA